MKIVIAGATGFIGKALCENLVEHHHVVALTRDRQKAAFILPKEIEILNWDAVSSDKQKEKFSGCDAIINLTGVSIAQGRWTKKQRAEILNSRINSTKILIEYAKSSDPKPEVMMLASAIGFYGNGGDKRLNEDSSAGDGFLSGVCQQIEGFAKEIRAAGIRDVVIRTSIVLDARGGALGKMILPFKFFLGSKFGNGQQWMSWISLADEIAAIRFVIDNQNLNGVFNLSSPVPVRNGDFVKTLASALHRRCFIALPEKMLKVLFGPKAEELFLLSQKVYPDRLLDAGFKFKYPDLKSAFESMNF